jgi:dihydroxyacetone kinase
MAAGKQLAGTATLDAGAVGDLLEACARSVAERGGATAGERTMLDAMEPAARAAREAAAAGSSAARTLELAADAADAGAAATAEMEAQHGRAGWLRDRAQGTPDAGATAWALFLHGLAAGVQPVGEQTPTA